jgi:pyridine nucleotide-disulfide oxidoreductase family protein
MWVTCHSWNNSRPMTATASHAAPPAQKTQQLVLLGAGHAHIQVLAQLAAQPLPGTVVTLVSPGQHLVYSGMVPGFVAGHYPLDNCVIPLEPLVQRSGIRWIERSAVGVDAQKQLVQLDDGSTLPFDWLSVNTGPVQDRERIERDLPGAREHGLFIRPMEAFSALWPRVVEMGEARALRIAVVGAGAGGIELAMAARHRLPSAAVTLVCGLEPPGSVCAPSVQQRIIAALKKRNITVLQDTAVSLKAGSVQLGCGADLACDVPVLAMGAHAPPWLKGSGLALDSNGFLAVDMYQRSTSHSRVFAAGDVSTRMDRPLARSGVYAVRAGTALAHNLAAAVAGSALKPHQPPARTLNLLSCGGRYAIAAWGSFSAQGWWVWRLKNWIDTRFVARFSRPSV